MVEKSKGLILGLDTSNYTTSAAVVDEEGNLVADERIMLTVKRGERGLRQSDALFQHGKNMVILLQRIFNKIRGNGSLVAVAVSTRPRSVEGSYMPVFLAGQQQAQILASALNIDVFSFSHQDGHLAAIMDQNVFGGEDDRKIPEGFLAFHMSGGTGELLSVKPRSPQWFYPWDISIIGGTKDLSFGQVIDRAGVAIGLDFPAGAEMDRMAVKAVAEKKQRGEIRYSRTENTLFSEEILSPIHMSGLDINLSGIETQCQIFRKQQENQGTLTEMVKEELAYQIFARIGDVLIKMCKNACDQESTKQIVFVGGVSASAFLRERLNQDIFRSEIQVHFGKPELSSDNAVGIANLGRMALRKKRLKKK